MLVRKGALILSGWIWLRGCWRRIQERGWPSSWVPWSIILIIIVVKKSGKILCATKNPTARYQSKHSAGQRRWPPSGRRSPQSRAWRTGWASTTCPWTRWPCCSSSSPGLYCCPLREPRAWWSGSWGPDPGRQGSFSLLRRMLITVIFWFVSCHLLIQVEEALKILMAYCSLGEEYQVDYLLKSLAAFKEDKKSRW